MQCSSDVRGLSCLGLAESLAWRRWSSSSPVLGLSDLSLVARIREVGDPLLGNQFLADLVSRSVGISLLLLPWTLLQLLTAGQILWLLGRIGLVGGHILQGLPPDDEDDGQASEQRVLHVMCSSDMRKLSPGSLIVERPYLR